MRCRNCIQRHKVQKETWINFASRCWAEKMTQTFLMRTKSFSHSVRLLISSSYLRGRKTKEQVTVRWCIFNSVMSGNRLSVFPKGTVGGASGPSSTTGYHRIRRVWAHLTHSLSLRVKSLMAMSCLPLSGDMWMRVSVHARVLVCRALLRGNVFFLPPAIWNQSPWSLHNT